MSAAGNAFKGDVAAYLGVEPEDIDRMVAEDKLPCLRLLGKKRFIHKFPLRGVHAWLVERTENAPREMLDFERFREDFAEAVKARKSAG
jgi:hypothetical protein